MQPSAEPETRLPSGWDAMLPRVEQALASAAAATAQREQALQAVAPAPSAVAAVLQGLDRSRDRMHGLAECAAGADAMVAEADAALGGAEDALRAWFQAAEAARRTLANWAGKA